VRPNAPSEPLQILTRACDRAHPALLKLARSAWNFDCTLGALVEREDSLWVELQWVAPLALEGVDSMASLNFTVGTVGYQTGMCELLRRPGTDTLLLRVPPQLTTRLNRSQPRKNTHAQDLTFVASMDGAETAQFPVLDVSSSGLLLELPFSSVAARPGDALQGLLLSEGRAVLTVNGRISHRIAVVRANGERCWRMGVKLLRTKGQVPRRTAAPLGWQAFTDAVAEPASVLRMLRAAERSQTAARLRGSGGDIEGTLMVAGEGDAASLWFIPWSSPVVSPGDLQLEFDLYATTVLGTSRILRTHEGWLELCLPSVLQRVVRRRQRRLTQREAGEIRLTHPVFGARRYSLRDVTFEGLGLDAPADRSELLQPGMLLQHLSIKVAGEKVLVPTAYVRTVEGTRVGVEFGELTQKNRARLITALMRLAYPDLDHPRPEEAESLFEFCKARGLFRGVRGEYIVGMRKDVIALWSKLFAEPGPMYRTLVMRENGEPTMTSSYVQAYEQTLVGQHAVADKRGARVPVRRFVSAQFDLFDWTGMRWQMSMMNKVNAGAQALFLPGGHTATRWYARRDVGLYAHYNLEGLPHVEAPYGTTIERLPDAEEALLSRMVHAHDGDAWADADAVHPGQLRLPETRKAYARRGLLRERDWFVARAGRRILTAVSVQRATPGISFGQSLHVGRLYLLHSDASDVLVQALMMKALGWYREKGEPWAWWLCASARERACVEAAGMVKTDDFVSLVVHRNGFQAYQHDVAASMGAASRAGEP